jgi:hypothetical protein
LREAGADQSRFPTAKSTEHNVSFKVIREFQDNKITQEFKGTVSGTELKLTVSGGRGGPVEVTYKTE